MVAPNPITVGAVVVTGLVYGVSSIMANKKSLREIPGKIADAGHWAGEKLEEGAGKLVDGAKSVH
ncbi:hypothetical protein [Streptomyces capillispiralis]|uniref:Uncharacterized protein n=1 Tax=Streptomyces capillispiralis TaxID=68182 RepID=A0A561TFQ2_9ACTN|nr:hypothetical protein [Streptomyces capillispiralis]TWF85944.1 hypothetical protein FHX78_112902 [Streptomyces capillispiralis]GHH89510.1 hypothetical protein GCM10017779_00930 [Streptomyces capillispiralis]